MSGGYFQYQQYRINDIVYEIQRVIERVNSSGEYSNEVIEKFKLAVMTLQEAAIYAQRIDWLLSGDDSEESFLLRLEEDLDKLSRGKNAIH